MLTGVFIGFDLAGVEIGGTMNETDVVAHTATSWRGMETEPRKSLNWHEGKNLQANDSSTSRQKENTQCSQ